MKAVIFILFGLLPVFVVAGGSAPRGVCIDGHTYGLVEFKSGLPDFKPITRRIVAEARSAIILLPDSLGLVRVCLGRNKEGAKCAYLMNTRCDSSVNILPLDVRSIDADTLKGTAILRLLPSMVATYPFEFRIVPSQGVLCYRWILSDDDPRIPGGLPVPNPSLISMGRAFPSYEVSLLNGTKCNLAEPSGRLRVLNWWYINCYGCILEMPGLNSLASKYRDKVEFLAVTIDPIDSLTTFLRAHAFEYVQTLADTSAYAIFGDTAPRNIVLDESGRVIFDQLGGSKDASTAIEAVLRKQLPRE